ncbi:hybrid sensor histidine kinase/response regulator [Roseicella frigidaeris]|uniref:histidine kinase n=1 Tax=Roseicella frigidaeris TaxID=2230885 RepID=A0A327MEX7_9PROT|nr:ATP-binding protein [Roseicella frigidaeris]RAI60822.1 hypothetical protein DOO78_01450 [Roseicella frigidaeris]
MDTVLAGGAQPSPPPVWGAPAPADLGTCRVLADVLDSLDIGLCLFDAQDRTLLWNRTFLRLFPEHAGHVAVGEPYAANLRRFYAVRLRPEERHTMDQCVAEGIARHRVQTQPFIFEHRGQWVRVASQPLPGLGRIRIWTPIAPPVDARAAMPDPADHVLREVMPFTAENGDGVTVLGADGRIMAANGRFVRLFGLSGTAEAVGRTHAELYAEAWRRLPEEERVAAAALQTLAEGERFAGAPFELPLPGGAWVRVLQQRLLDGTVVSTFADISAMKTLQRQLNDAREAAELANRAKDGFLATVSHELRTPMNGILGMLDVLDDGRLGPDQAERLQLARHSAEALLGLLDDILTFSRLEAGHVAAEWLPVSLPRIVETVAGLMRSRAVQKGLTLAWRIDPRIPAAVLCDAANLRQILLNLIGNAIKFTDQGAVEVTVRCDEMLSPSRLRLEFLVEDTGIGIPAAALDAIFEPFVQADSGIARRFGGTGLGLAICRRLVHAMGGEITVSSTEGQGSCFRFSLVCEAVAEAGLAVPLGAAPGAPGSQGQALPRLHVLVVDDHPINREIAKLHLEHLGMSVVTAPGGREAVAACADRFDVILMDLEMPCMDGFATVAAIRAGVGASAVAPVIAVTAHAGEEHRTRCREAGMQAFLAKPIRAEQLKEAIAAVLGGRPPTASAHRSPPAPAAAEILDQERVASLRTHIPPPTWAQLLAEFEANAREAMAALASAAEQGGDHRLTAHGLKGTAWNFGARRLGNLAASLEGASGAQLRSCLAELGTTLEATLIALRAGRDAAAK